MAKMKVEFLHASKTKHGFTVRDRLVAHLPDYAAALGRIAFLPNLRDRVPGLAWLSEKLTGLSARRSLPRWRRDNFWRSHDRNLFISREMALATAKVGGKVAALFVDTFNGHFESENAAAATQLLHKAGYALYLVTKDDGQHCCGRTFLAAGMVGHARAKLAALIDDLLPLADAGIAIVGLEPSCLLTLRDEALAMGLGDTARTVSKAALLLEEFIAREAKAGRFALTFQPAGAPILLHGHCHQKAFGAMPAIMNVLRLIPDAKPELIETSCCGMAGSFGYDHYDVSMQMAELSLLPAIRKQPDAVIVAGGTSCRHQIADGAARAAIPVAVLLNTLSVSPPA
jgi:Fe-S oxidoreductase